MSNHNALDQTKKTDPELIINNNEIINATSKPVSPDNLLKKIKEVLLGNQA